MKRRSAKSSKSAASKKVLADDSESALLQSRQLARSNNDRQNLIAATDIATIFLDRELRIQHFTPLAKAIFNLSETDIGRPLSDLNNPLDYPAIITDVEGALTNLQCAEREVRAGERWYIARTLPYRTADDHIAGVVLTFFDISTQKDSENALRASEERSAFVRQSGGLGFWCCDLPFNVLQWDPLVKAHFHLPPDAAVTIETFYERIHPGDREPTREAIERSIADHSNYDMVYRTVDPVSGAVKWVQAIGRTFYAADGTPSRFDGVTLDVSETKRAEEALQINQEQSRLAVEVAGLGVTHIDYRTQTVVLDPTAAGLFGLEARVTLPRSAVHARVHPEDRPKIMQLVERSLDPTGGGTFSAEHRVVLPDGSIRWLSVKKAVTFADVAGIRRPVVGIEAAMDITDRKMAEEALRLSEERSAFVRRSSGVGFWYCDLPFDVLQWDELVKAHFHLPPDAAVTIQTFYDYIYPEDREPTRQAIERSIADHSHYDTIYRTVDPASGAINWIRAIGRTFYAADGTPTRFDGVTLDVSEQKRAELELRDVDRRKDEFLATLAHELRNPLAPIRNGLQIMRLAGANGTIEQARSMMDRQLTQLVRLVDDLLDVSRVTSGKLQLRKERIELKSVIDAAVETSQPVIEQAGHKLLVTMADQPIFVDGDSTRLSQVVSNLLNNSAKYTHRGGQIRLSVQHQDETAVISVSDNGIGIPPDMLNKVFEMFSQVDRALEKTTGGLGIGLSLVKGLVEMHGGSIEARSNGEGLGSEFLVHLPILRSVVQAIKPEEADKRSPRSAHHRILVSDDNLDSMKSLGQLLELLGNEVRMTHDGLRAVEVAEVFRPNIVLLDIGMPIIDGYETCRRMRERPWSKQTIFIALTGFAQDEDKLQSHKAGFNHHMVKPVDFAALEKLLAELQRPQA